jgi:hypothetical protein
VTQDWTVGGSDCDRRRQRRVPLPASRRIAEDFSKSLSTGVLRRGSFSIRAEDGYTFRGRRNDLPLETHTHRSVRLTFKRS